MNIADIFTIIGVIAAIIGTGIAGFQTWLALQDKKIPTIKDERVLIILRALVNEEQGRSLNIYKDNPFYRRVLKDLAEENEDKKLIIERGDKYFLTEIGKKVVRKHLKDWMRQK